MPLYDAVKDLPLTIERVELEPHALPLKHFTRRTTVVHLHGAGHEGVGEDVSYEEAHHQDDALPDLTGEHTLDSFSALVAAAAGLPRGGSSRRRSTSRCGRRDARSPTPSAASRSR